MSRYVNLRLTREQAATAINACDLLRDQYEADNQKREAGRYRRACDALSKAMEHG